MSNSSPAPSSHWPRRIILGLLAFGFVTGIAGAIYENVSEAHDRRTNVMPGNLVDADGFKMHIDCVGQGSPTVILESGLGDSYVSWRKVQPQIARFSRVCSYDRAGLGYSESSSRLRASGVMAEELHALLRSAGIAPPYILVGHSMGGFIVRLFASLYGNEVVGMVLIDSSHPDQDNRFPPELKNMEGTWLREAEFLEFTTPFGIPRLMGLCDEEPTQRAAECNFHTAREGVAELKAFPRSAAETAASGPLGDMPLTVLSHDPDKPSSELPPDLAKPTNDAWEQMQEELAHLSTRGTQMIAKNSAHYIQIDRIDVVVDAVRKIVEQTRAAETSSSTLN
ncbi:MAG TPA: alpha/beta hydrolase [Candidatus Sulfotelmatobacter sp.]|nr:alpha/beta hydrolase [Candidatus Sulfotelmatobacter sp.]